MLGNLSDLDLRLLRVFLAVVEAGGVSAAQSTLNVSQSTISSQLATLETRLGFRLCERGRAGFRLTPKGDQLVASSRRLLEAVDLFCVEARRLDRKLVGQLRIGLIGHTAMSANARLSEAIARFRNRDEAVQLSLAVQAPGELEEAVINGEIDVGIGYFWHRVPSLEYIPLFEERQVAYCGRDHPLCDAAGDLDALAVAEHDWVWRSYPLPEAQLPTRGVHVTALADNMEAVAVLILSGHHLGYLPAHFAAPLVEQGLLAALNPSDLRYDVTFHMITRRQAHRGEVLQTFVDDLVHVHGGAVTA